MLKYVIVSIIIKHRRWKWHCAMEMSAVLLKSQKQIPTFCCIHPILKNVGNCFYNLAVVGAIFVAQGPHGLLLATIQYDFYLCCNRSSYTILDLFISVIQPFFRKIIARQSQFSFDRFINKTKCLPVSLPTP